MNFIFKSLSVIFIALIFPLFIATIIYDTERFDEINRKKIIKFEKILRILDKLEYILVERVKLIGDHNVKINFSKKFSNNLKELEKEYTFLKIFSNKKYTEIDLIIKEISKINTLEIYSDNITKGFTNEKNEAIYYKGLIVVADNIKILKDKFYDEYHKSLNENPMIKTFNRTTTYPKDLNFDLE